MELSGTHTFDAPRQTVYQLMTDPAVLRRTLPGCRSLEPRGNGIYDITLNIGISILKGTYKGTVQLLNEIPSKSFSLKLDTKGGVGAVSGQGNFDLAPGAGNKTLLTYTGEAHVAGKVSFFARPLIKAGAAMVIGQFLSALDKALTMVPAK
jgi:carbon monoxide dehydrogenase subunit G